MQLFIGELQNFFSHEQYKSTAVQQTKAQTL